MHEQLITRQIRACEVRAEYIRSGLPFADGPAYSQDRDRLKDALSEAAAWRAILEIVRGAQA